MLVSTLVATIGLAFSVRAWGDLGACRIPLSFVSLAPLYPYSHLSPALDAASKRHGLGHKTVANVARQLLARSPYGVQRVNEILAADAFIPPDQPSPTLVDIASWADSFSATKKGQFSKGYHYIAARDNPASDCGIDMMRDCNGTGECIVKAM